MMRNPKPPPFVLNYDAMTCFLSHERKTSLSELAKSWRAADRDPVSLVGCKIQQHFKVPKPPKTVSAKSPVMERCNLPVRTKRLSTRTQSSWHVTTVNQKPYAHMWLSQDPCILHKKSRHVKESSRKNALSKSHVSGTSPSGLLVQPANGVVGTRLAQASSRRPTCVAEHSQRS